MKESELRKNANCSLCGNKILETGIPMFWKVSVQRYGIDLGAVQRQQGLTMMMGGNAEIASVMGPNEDLAKPFDEIVELSICEECCTREVCVAQLAEIGSNEY